MAAAEMYINQLDDQTVLVDLSHEIRRLANPETTFGFAYKETLSYLGFKVTPEPTDWLPRIQVAGTLETAQERVPDLQQHIGSIASKAADLEIAFRSHNRNQIERFLGRMVQRTIPELVDDIRLPTLAYVVARPFAEELYDGGVIARTDACKAPWLASAIELGVRDRKTTLTGMASCIPTNPVMPPEEELAQLDNITTPSKVMYGAKGDVICVE